MDSTFPPPPPPPPPPLELPPPPQPDNISAKSIANRDARWTRVDIVRFVTPSLATSRPLASSGCEVEARPSSGAQENWERPVRHGFFRSAHLPVWAAIRFASLWALLQCDVELPLALLLPQIVELLGFRVRLLFQDCLVGPPTRACISKLPPFAKCAMDGASAVFVIPARSKPLGHPLLFSQKTGIPDTAWRF
jgi:hypothetical protein